MATGGEQPGRPRAKLPAELKAERAAKRLASDNVAVGNSYKPAKSGRVVSQQQFNSDHAAAGDREHLAGSFAANMDKLENDDFELEQTAPRLKLWRWNAPNL